jgi:ABC-type multidrug transport system fused ATPase/permease subunit
VGPSGAGKSTLADLLVRFYDPEQGAIRLDGRDLRELRLEDVRRHVMLLDQAPYLLHATVRENIAYARPDATTQEIELAARRAQAHAFISELPNGYDTQIGERGLTLSGGQRQRIALARAMVADPRILILDDATSSVDASTEQEIKAGLRELMAGRTTFVIAHRLSTIALADEIIVLEHGEIAAHGDHDELLERSPLYREIVEKGLPEQVFLTRKPLEPEVAGL